MLAIYVMLQIETAQAHCLTTNSVIFLHTDHIQGMSNTQENEHTKTA